VPGEPKLRLRSSLSRVTARYVLDTGKRAGRLAAIYTKRASQEAGQCRCRRAPTAAAFHIQDRAVWPLAGQWLAPKGDGTVLAFLPQRKSWARKAATLSARRIGVFGSPSHGSPFFSTQNSGRFIYIG
jgi:hypothetical protein